MRIHRCTVHGNYITFLYVYSLTTKLSRLGNPKSSNPNRFFFSGGEQLLSACQAIFILPLLPHGQGMGIESM